jgi:hypothetical protein
VGTLTMLPSVARVSAPSTMPPWQRRNVRYNVDRRVRNLSQKYLEYDANDCGASLPETGELTLNAVAGLDELVAAGSQSGEHCVSINTDWTGSPPSAVLEVEAADRVRDLSCKVTMHMSTTPVGKTPSASSHRTGSCSHCHCQRRHSSHESHSGGAAAWTGERRGGGGAEQTRKKKDRKLKRFYKSVARAMRGEW